MANLYEKSFGCSQIRLRNISGGQGRSCETLWGCQPYISKYAKFVKGLVYRPSTFDHSTCHPDRYRVCGSLPVSQSFCHFCRALNIRRLALRFPSFACWNTRRTLHQRKWSHISLMRFSRLRHQNSGLTASDLKLIFMFKLSCST